MDSNFATIFDDIFAILISLYKHAERLKDHGLSADLSGLKTQIDRIKTAYTELQTHYLAHTGHLPPGTSGAVKK
jgi:hypothetical protein